RGIHALRDIGLADQVLANSIVMRGRMMHDRGGALTFQPYGKDGTEVLHSVSRAGLNRLLIEAAAKYGTVQMHFGRRCNGLNSYGTGIEFLDANEEPFTVPAGVIVGADGAYSAVRFWMQKREGFNYQQEYLSHGYKELTIPAGPDGTHRIEKHALHI